MSQESMPLETPPEEMWTLSADRKTVRLDIPAIPVAGVGDAIRIHLDFDAHGADEVLKRLIVLRARMPETQ
jgi:hypothetical protein